MKKVSFFFLLLSGLALAIFFFTRQTQIAFINPYLSSESITGLEPKEQLSSDVAVSCVLSYGTFLVSQGDCDELTQGESSSAADSNAVSCTISAGTFLVSSHECEILKNSQGSHDVMERIDD